MHTELLNRSFSLAPGHHWFSPCIMRPAIATVSLGRSTAGHDILSKLRAASAFGFEGVEIFFECLEHHGRKLSLAGGCSEAASLLAAASDVRKTCDELGLEVVCLQPFTFYDGLVDEERHRQRIEDARLWFRICRVLETDLIQIPSNFAMEGTTGKMESLVADLEEVALLGLSEARPIRFAYEAISWGDHVDLWERSWEIVQTVNQPNMGLCLDVFHIAGRVWADPTASTGRVADGEAELERSLARMVQSIDPKKIFYVQVGDAARMHPPLDETHALRNPFQRPRMTWSRNERLYMFEEDRGGYLPVWPICEVIFKRLCWQGWVSMEMFNQSLHQTGAEVITAHAARAQTSWKKLLGKLDSQRHAPSSRLKEEGKVVLYGIPISQSLSPIFNNTLWSLIGLPWQYELVETTNIDNLYVQLHFGKYIGASITMPYKIKAMAMVDTVSEEAQIIGAINTINVVRDTESDCRRLFGDNLDWKGMVVAIEHGYRTIQQVPGTSVGLIMGAGATARTAVYVMCKHFRLSTIYVVNRDAREVTALTHDISKSGLRVRLLHVATPEDVQCCVRPTLAIGAIPDTVPSTPEEQQARSVVANLMALPKTALAHQSCLLDMCYSPDPETTLIAMAKRADWVTISGVDVLAAINLLQNEVWQGRKREDFLSPRIEARCMATMTAALANRKSNHRDI